MASKEIRKWSDEFMFEAEAIDTSNGPEVFLLNCNNDPLGSIAAAAKAYMGEFVDSLAQITDEERRHYLAEVRKTALAMPLESVNFHFRIKGVTRGFTHQMVRQRTAAYSQESTRFAVKTTVPVGLPPSLIGTLSREEWRQEEIWKAEEAGAPLTGWKMEDHAWKDREASYASKAQKWRFKWDDMMQAIATGYNELVDDGMPAEDARGSLPTNLLTQLNYFTNLRNLQVEAGKRLCTQAQFEWRIVLTKLVAAIRDYGDDKFYYGSHTEETVTSPAYSDSIDGRPPVEFGARPGDTFSQPSRWQFEALADIFRPVCYLEGKCPFKADFDRKCSIRGRVDANANINRPSTEWHLPIEPVATFQEANSTEDYVGIPAIRPEEWLTDPSAAR